LTAWRKRGEISALTQGNIMNQKWLRLACAGALMLLAQLAHAQYSWIDDKGTRVFSDRPPPPGTPSSRILKAPRSPQTLQPVATPAPSSAAANAKPVAPPLAERDADFRKRATERAEGENKAKEEMQRKAEQAEDCKAARQAQAQLQTGTRVARVDEKGERGFLSDEERASQLQRAQRVLAGCR
jgi:type IV secretory pathway VirB10-like protein